MSIYIIDTDYQQRKVAKLLETTSSGKKNRTETEYEETPRKPPRTLIHCAKRTIVHATNVGSMGARNLQNCNVEIHHHVHESPVKEMKSSKMLNEPKLKITLEEE